MWIIHGSRAKSSCSTASWGFCTHISPSMSSTLDLDGGITTKPLSRRIQTLSTSRVKNCHCINRASGEPWRVCLHMTGFKLRQQTVCLVGCSEGFLSARSSLAAWSCSKVCLLSLDPCLGWSSRGLPWHPLHSLQTGIRPPSIHFHFLPSTQYTEKSLCTTRLLHSLITQLICYDAVEQYHFA